MVTAETSIQPVYFKVREFPLGVTIGGRTVGSSVAPKAPRYLELQEDVDTAITDLGNQFKDLHSGSITAQKIQRLHNYWLLGEAGEVQIPEHQKVVLDYLFNKFGKGIVLDNGVDYNDQGDLEEREGFARAAIVTHPKRFYKGGQWQIDREGSEVAHDYVPPTGFPLLTNDGIYNPDTFIPFATVPSREVAEQSHTAKGVSPEIARKAVGKFWSRDEGQGVAAVYVYCGYGSDYGRFDLGADDGPGGRVPVVGRLASRPASGASQASEDPSALVVSEPKLIEVLEAEYLSLLSRAERATTLEGKMKVIRETSQE